MARKFPNKGLKGTTGRPSPGLIPAKPKIVIVCEGKVTEPRYFNDFTDHHGNSLVTVTTIGGCGVPLCVVERAVREKHALTHTARRSKDSYDQQFDVWAVFDRDAHPKPQVPQAFALAKRHGIRIAFANPCSPTHVLNYGGSCTLLVSLDQAAINRRNASSSAYCPASAMKKNPSSISMCLFPNTHKRLAMLPKH